MTRFATATKTPARVTKAPKAPKGVIKTKKTQPVGLTTYNGAEGFARKAKSELFLLGVTNMVSQDTFYESGKVRDQRFIKLLHEVTASDPAWVASFIPYLRGTLNMRTASVVAAAEYVRAGGPNGRSVVSGALQRADEPSELLAYWGTTYGTTTDGGRVKIRPPQAIKRGVADAVQRLYTERSLIKYDADSLLPRFGDVIQITHAKAQTPWQHDLFRYAMAKRYNRDDLSRDTESLSTIRKYRELMATPTDQRRALVEKAAETGDFSAIEGAGLTWENLSGWLQGPMDARAWEAIIPQMGYMALIRNLRNFDDAKISPEARDRVAKKLTDPAEVAASRQLPLRFLSAYKNVSGAFWTPVLETALDLVLANVPSLKGRTLVLVDVSGSMDAGFANNSKRTFQHSTQAKYPTRWEAAALFGAALAVRAEKADLVAFESDSYPIDFRKGASILKTVDEFQRVPHGGTNTWQAFARHYSDHDRVVIITDEQADPGSRVTTGKNTYVFNLAGYATAMAPSGSGLYTFGGLTDHGFAAIEALENFKDEVWPWDSAE